MRSLAESLTRYGSAAGFSPPIRSSMIEVRNSLVAAPPDSRNNDAESGPDTQARNLGQTRV